MFRLSARKISLAASALLLCAGFAQAQTEPASPLTAAPASVSIAYTLPSTQGAAVPVAFSVASGTDAFVIDPTTVPFWLSLGAMSGTATTTPVSINFQASTTAGTLGGGIYTTSVHVRVSGFADLVVPVTLSVNEPSSTLSLTTTPTETSGTVDLTYTPGSTTYPTATISVLSNDQPVAFTDAVSTTGLSPAAPSTWVQLSAASGIAYSFGTPLTVSFLKDVLQNAAVGSVLTATVNISYGSTPTVLSVPIQITILQPPAAVSATAPLFPAAAPVQTSGSLSVVVTGSGFYAAASGITPTQVKIAYGTVTTPVDLTTITSKTGAQTGSVTVVNPTTMILSIPFEDGTPVDILSTAQAINITISNNLTGETAATAALNITTNPIINSVTDAASLQEPAAGTAPKLAPYELISIFGANFCPGGCSSPVVATVTSSRYPTTLSAGTGTLSVTFNNQSGTQIAEAYLLFANDNQINALVPSTIISSTITGLQIVVSTSTTASSAPYLATPVAYHPGIFTTSSSGQGQGAILLSADYSVNSSTNPALVGNTVLIYLSGLGAPNSTAALTNTGTPAFPTSCFSPATYVTDEGLTNPATADGAVLVSTVWGTGNLPPCFATKGYTTVTINGVAATVGYAGWVADSVTGLYQINATIPKGATTSTSAVSVPVVVTVGSGTTAVSSQTGVTMYIKN